MSEDGTEKVVEASPERKKKARQKGDVPVSMEANTAAALGGFLIALLLVSPFVETLAVDLRGLFIQPEASARSVLWGDHGGALLQMSIFFVLPLVAIPATAVVVSLAAQQGIVFAPNKIQPDLKKINPLEGAKKKFGGQAVIEFLKNTSKVTVMTITGAGIIAYEAQRLSAAVASNPSSLAVLLLRETIIMFMMAGVISLAFAGVDIILVRAQREKRLKMSQQEAKDEAKDSEGNQEVKGQRRKRAEKIALNRMLKATETADVLVVNPTHYAVALSWQRDQQELPTCVAKGTDEVALRLREIARRHNVPIKSDPPAARSLHATVDIGEPIKPEHFAAVAAALRFADAMRAKRRR